MSPDERYPAHLWDMLQAARLIVELLGPMTYDEFMADTRTRLAIERELEILGEAARRVSDALRRRHPEVPWLDIVGLRNIISHQYDRIDYPKVHRIVTCRVPALIALLEPLVPSPPDEDAATP